MNKKVLGASLRRGVVTGTVAGFAAGWLTFVGHGKQLDAIQLDANNEVDQKRADLVLPPVPALPAMGNVPDVQTYRLRYGPDGPLPRVAPGGAPASTVSPATTRAPGGTTTVPAGQPAALPTFAPLPTLPPAPVVPAPTTGTSAARR